jgi:hypothetical protein
MSERLPDGHVRRVDLSQFRAVEKRIAAGIDKTRVRRCCFTGHTGLVRSENSVH